MTHLAMPLEKEKKMHAEQFFFCLHISIENKMVCGQ